jgi:hypothetical protein
MQVRKKSKSRRRSGESEHEANPTLTLTVFCSTGSGPPLTRTASSPAGAQSRLISSRARVRSLELPAGGL